MDVTKYFIIIYLSLLEFFINIYFVILQVFKNNQNKLTFLLFSNLYI